MHPCQIDSSKTKGKTLTWPTVPGESPLFKAPSDRRNSALNKRMKGVGKIRRDFVQTWTIDGVGKVVVERFKTDGTPEKLGLLIPIPSHFQPFYMPSEPSEWQFPAFDPFDGGRVRVLRQRKPLYGAYDLMMGRHLSSKRCTTGASFKMVAAPLSRRRARSWMQPAYKATRHSPSPYQIPGKKRWRKILEPTVVTYPVVNNHALAPQLVKMGHFTKKP